MTTVNSVKPWYREPWPWLLMLGPFVVVVAALYTAWLAVVTSDGLVADDYYRQGLAVGKTIASSESARQQGLAVNLRLREGGITVRLAARDGNFPAPPALLVTLSHPTRAGLDQSARLELAGPEYAGKLRLPSSGHWLVIVEDDAKSWRLMGNVVLPSAGDIEIGAIAKDASK